MTSAYDAAILALSPTGYWKMSDAVGSNSCADSSGNGHTLTVAGGGISSFGWAGPLLGNALAEQGALFTNSDAVSSALSVPANPTALTMIAWFNAGMGQVPANLLSLSDTAFNLIALEYQESTFTANSTPVGTIGWSNAGQVGWHMTALVINGTTISVYLDGELVNSITNGTAFTFGSHGSTIVTAGGISPAYEGLIAECTLWTGTALTAGQVLTLYQTAIPSSTLIPKVFNVSLNGLPFTMADAEPFYREYRRQLEPLIRTQADTSNLPGEQSMDPNGLWRRSFEDWRQGANQRYLDRSTSLDNAYWQSKGVDTLTNAWQISLLPTTLKSRASANTNLEMLWASGYVYIIDGTSVLSTPISSITPGASLTWTAVTGTPGVAISSACTDGSSVYLACGASGVYVIPNGGSASQLVTSAIDSAAVVGYCNGRLMLGSTNNLYNIISTTPAVLPGPLQTWGNPNTRVTCFATGNNWLYVGVNIGGVGYIYGVQTTADGTTLNAPAVQGQMPNGEKIFSLLGYLGFLVAGTGLGVRVCQQGSTGVTLGTLITTGAPVTCLAAYGQFVWFGWTNYDNMDTGLGKISLENFVVPGILPAYASDRMATAGIQGAVTGVVVVNNIALFAVSGNGFWLDHSNLVAFGTVQSGYILYGISDPKVAALVDVVNAGLNEPGSYQVAVSADSGPFVTVGAAGPQNQATVNTYAILGGSGGRFEVLLTLFPDVGTPSTGPTITRWTLRSYPAPLRPRTWQLPLVFNEVIGNASGQSKGFDPQAAVLAIEQMALSGEPVLYQEGDESFYVFVTDFSFIGREVTSDRHYFNGLGLVNIQELPTTAATVA